MPNLNADLNITFNATQSFDNDFGGPTFTPTLAKQYAFTYGTGAAQADILFADERTVAAGANDDLDLAGVLTNAAGSVITNAEIAGIIIAADAANANAINVGGGTSPWITMWLATGDGIKVFPGGTFVNVAPDASGLGAVTATTADILRVANPGGVSAKYKIIILGRTA